MLGQALYPLAVAAAKVQVIVATGVVGAPLGAGGEVLPAVVSHDAVGQPVRNEAVEDAVDRNPVHGSVELLLDHLVAQRRGAPLEKIENSGLGSGGATLHEFFLQLCCGYCGQVATFEKTKLPIMVVRPLYLLFVSSLFVLFISSCDDDDDTQIENESELITDVVFTLTPQTGGGQATVYTFTDRDGDGGDPPTLLVAGSLQPNTTYAGSIQLLNASDPSDIENITLEVDEEDEEHQFFYRSSGGLDLTVAYADSDDDGNPVGLLTTVTTGASSSGGLTIILRHEPNKTASGVTIDDPSAAGGETDVEVTFDVSF